MKLYAFIVVLLALQLAQAITKYEFNSCRITNCNAEEINCISD